MPGTFSALWVCFSALFSPGCRSLSHRDSFSARLGIALPLTVLPYFSGSPIHCVLLPEVWPLPIFLFPRFLPRGFSLFHSQYLLLISPGCTIPEFLFVISCLSFSLLSHASVSLRAYDRVYFDVS